MLIELTMKLEHKHTLEDLLDGCKAGNRKSQEMLYKACSGKMLGVCMRYAKDHFEAEDMMQTGFIKIFKKINDFRGEGSFEGWIRRIVANTAIDAIRKSKKDPFLTDNDNDFKLGAEDRMVEQEELDLRGLKAEIAMEAIQKLSPAYRSVFNLYVLENYSHKEIGELLGISEGTSKSNLAKARMNLQKMLNEKFMNIE